MIAITPRQKDVLCCFANGMRRKEAAIALSIDEATIKTHLQDIKIRLGATTREHAVAIAFAEGVLGKEDLER